MTNKEKHKVLIEEWYNNYKDKETENEFTWDGPSDWDLWESSNPKILFLCKEATANGFHPASKENKVSQSFGHNIVRWKLAIKAAITENKTIDYPDNKNLPETYHDICIVEIKKLNEGKSSSNNREIAEYAKKDKALLKKQLDLINPQIIVCCGTFDNECYDIIYDYSFKVEEELAIVERCSCWLIDNRLVIEFYHPSSRISSVELFNILSELMTHPSVQKNITKIYPANQLV